jgi:chromate reductase
MKVLGIAGSLRRASYNRALLAAAVELAPPELEIEVFDISALPPYNQDLEADLPASVVALKAAIIASDALLFVTPEYNFSVPGVLKNVIDWGSRPHPENAWDNKPAAVMGASMAFTGTARAQSALRQSFAFINVDCMNQPGMYVAAAHDKFSAEGKLTDEETREHLAKFLAAYAAWLQKMTPAI